MWQYFMRYCRSHQINSQVISEENVMQEINRRSFLAASTLAVAGLAGRATAKKLDRIGLQLYTVRREMAQDFEGTLAKVAGVGYREVEFAGYFNRTPAQVRETLKRLNLTSPAAHIPIRSLRENLAEVIANAKTIGHHFVVCPYLDASERRSLGDYKRHAELFNRAGEACRQAGLEFGYHNHDFEFKAIDGQVPYDLLLAETDPKLVKMELDLYWISFAGQDPLAYFSRQPGRFPLVHVKDMARTPQRAAVEVGAGQIDFKRIFAAARQAGIGHFFVEQDEAAAPLQSIETSFNYLKNFDY
jgi:sugar phosphate isomerase/epimerase